MPKKQLPRAKPGPKPTKVNPKKKTYKLEDQAIDRLTKMAEMDGLSPSTMLERIIYAEWDLVEKYLQEEKKAREQGRPVPPSPLKPVTVGNRAKLALAELKKHS